MAVTLHRCANPGELLAAAGPLLEAREAEHNLMIGLLARMQRTGKTAAGGSKEANVYFAFVSEDGRPIAAAVRTPPHQLAISETDDLRIVVPLARDVHDVCGAIPGVLGSPPVSEAFAAEWHRLTGASVRLGMQQRIYRAERADLAARTPPGRMRVATLADRALLVEWFDAFMHEAVPHEPLEDGSGPLVDRRIDQPDTGLVLWEDAGRPVALAGYGGPTPHGIRIGPVYTPPDLRGHGYGTALVAALTQLLLAEGRRFCFLYTDLANPTSNSIYQRIGYEPVTDANQWVFE